ncbi:ArsR/SmtB family transcription factor [Flaviflagellibacter deserti]|uniref:ArsR/SmtB family transcription factor n=1 Tax=Flaviflagellibacter deserti TaxID=2267266 RepID=A0ABV9Z3H5_9HYPH
MSERESRQFPLPPLLSVLRAAGEETRLRILALLAQGELNVSDLTDILGQSQPRISRHLKLLVEAGLVERQREGSWAFFRLTDSEPASGVAQAVLQRLDRGDHDLARDRERLAEVRSSSAEKAAAYFSQHADNWENIRALHVEETAVEAAIRVAVGSKPIHAMLDIGTGTGRIIELLGPQATRSVGVDASLDMLSVARANLAHKGLLSAQLRQGDVYALPVPPQSFDLVVIHQVLHFLDEPARAIREAARALSPGGRLLIVDFAPHELEFLRDQHAHRRLGFAPDQVENWLRQAGLEPVQHHDLAAPGGEPDKLTVSIWLARDPRIITDIPLTDTGRAVA